MGRRHPDETFGRADHVIARTFTQHRFGHAPLEGRVMVASYAPSDGQLDIQIATKRPHAVKLNLANLLGLPFGNIRVRTGDIGGAFGSKGQVGRETICTAAAAMLLGATVQWAEDRTENLQMAGHGREEDLGSGGGGPRRRHPPGYSGRHDHGPGGLPHAALPVVVVLQFGEDADSQRLPAGGV